MISILNNARRQASSGGGAAVLVTDGLILNLGFNRFVKLLRNRNGMGRH
jgi:hypothetical protein